jgi:hypothetical protein
MALFLFMEGSRFLLTDSLFICYIVRVLPGSGAGEETLNGTHLAMVLGPGSSLAARQWRHSGRLSSCGDSLF